MKTIISYLMAVIASLGIYSNTFMVVDVQPHEAGGQEIIIEDYNGYQYSFISNECDWNAGDLCSCIVYDNGTEYVEDDMILSAEYIRVDRMYIINSENYGKIPYGFIENINLWP